MHCNRYFPEVGQCSMTKIHNELFSSPPLVRNCIAGTWPLLLVTRPAFRRRDEHRNQLLPHSLIPSGGDAWEKRDECRDADLLLDSDFLSFKRGSEAPRVPLIHTQAFQHSEMAGQAMAARYGLDPSR